MTEIMLLILDENLLVSTSNYMYKSKRSTNGQDENDDKINKTEIRLGSYKEPYKLSDPKKNRTPPVLVELGTTPADGVVQLHGQQI